MFFIISSFTISIVVIKIVINIIVVIIIKWSIGLQCLQTRTAKWFILKPAGLLGTFLQFVFQCYLMWSRVTPGLKRTMQFAAG